MFLQNVGKNLFDVFSIFACFYADSKIILFNIDFNMENKSYKKKCVFHVINLRRSKYQVKETDIRGHI